MVKSQHKNAICFLGIDPSPAQIKFMGSMHKFYDIYLLLHNSRPYLSKKYENRFGSLIKVILVDEQDCIKSGFTGSTYNEKGAMKCSTRDKVLFYFNNIENNYKNLWIIEEDVFIPSRNTLAKIDKNYPNEDLICSQIHKVDERWHWFANAKQQQKNKDLILRTMVCAIRCSSRLIKEVGFSAKKKGYLDMDEILFINLANDLKMKIKSIEELSNLFFYEHDLPLTWKEISRIKENFLYHPCKDPDQQIKLRSLIQSQIK